MITLGKHISRDSVQSAACEDDAAGSHPFAVSPPANCRVLQ
jgi:hypothetical protein